jgi:hypothetical protein
MTHAIVAGCSHTAGVGLDPADSYVSLLEKHYKFTVYNHGVSGGCCTDVLTAVATAIKAKHRPKFIVAQWPNPFRKHLWVNGQLARQNINSADESFNILVKHGDANFLEPWMQAVTTANLLCQLAQVPLINIMLENIDTKYLDRLHSENIHLHVDEKLPGRTWLFDNAAQDRIHHSPLCHQQWAERLIGIIDEYTTP